MASYGFGKHVLSQTYKNWFALSWHSWLSENEPHIWNFGFSPPVMEQTFVKSLNAGEKSGYYQRIIWPNFWSVALDDHNSVLTSTTLPSLVIVSITTASLSSCHVPVQNISQTILTSFLMNHHKPVTVSQYHLKTPASSGKQSLAFI